MKTQQPNPGIAPPEKIARRLRRIGIVVLSLALVSASLFYWQGRQSKDVSNDPSMGGFNKANQRQMEIMYGKMGTVTEDLVQHLKQPTTQAVIILLAGGFIAVACFYFARLLSCGESQTSGASEGTTERTRPNTPNTT